MLSKVIRMLGTVRDRTIEAILKYGDKAKYVIKVALEIAEENENKELGDFSYKQLIEKFNELNINYDPRMVLRALEKDYGILQTTYKSSNQHWWKFIDIEQTRQVVLEENTQEEEPEISLIIIQYNSLSVKEIEKKLMFYLKKPRLNDIDKRSFSNLAFDLLPKIVELYNRASQIEETYEIAENLRKIISLARRVSMRISNEKDHSKGFHKEEVEREDYNVNSLRLSNSENNF